jgi:putative transcriptional regulator
MTKRYLSPIMASIHETAEGLHAAGVMNNLTMRKFDQACLTLVRPLTASENCPLRPHDGASQAVFQRQGTPTLGHPDELRPEAMTGGNKHCIGDIPS